LRERGQQWEWEGVIAVIGINHNENAISQNQIEGLLML